MTTIISCIKARTFFQELNLDHSTV